ncbi:methylated-DNA--[protein]-cysteine S-methyltransferase [Meiothermus ruber]|jgi:methylated-DNA-[protein]-cysteine S-methyltransferase|uniref:Methylated-DNA--protein-cysteine methyltransferase n=1 Tax=Meiothermus ruber (strain ATCC 35948 / DSM 1279 / VKM B-1258 / 21) TaxID=504728 RepID=D3PKW4_MEIRD|nr:MGMT family protein [Meiothermus ruber]ADD28988.1 methylated-DNA/protein-cysteinemethyltransferase [Meiothermus ruber DSM 1279]AGK05562.1 methylated-DNA--protein-cysteine methyltransferase [Meiothermus ruber DSM 1279]GAO75908.1 methylated-DNA--protein-cysteine methyltransferase [Meiothermus ruber H328]
MHSLLIPTPVGPLYAKASPQGLLSVELLVLGEGFPERPNALLNDLARRVEAYFAGKGETFLQVPLDYSGLEARRIALYEEVRRIPPGQTRSYAQMGRLCGLTPRAVGAAMRACPFFLVVPAQRVIHADGRLGGFAGREGVKEWLLRWEGAQLSP